MAIAYKSQGAGVATEASGGALSPLCPAIVAANDILIAHCGYEGTTTTPSTPTGWTLLGGPYTIEAAYRHWVFGRIALETDDGATVAFGTPAVTTVRTARVYSFSGYVSGTIIDVVPPASFAHLSHATDPQMPTITTTLTGALAVAVVWQADDNTQDSATGESGGDWVEAVAEYTQLATTPDTGMGIQTCTPTANPGTVTGGTIATANDPCGVIGFEIRAQQFALVVANAAQAQAAVNLTLVQHFVPLVVANAAHAQAVDNLTITAHDPISELVVQATAQAHTADNLGLIQHNILAVTSAAQTQTADNTALTQHNKLAHDVTYSLLTLTYHAA